MRRWWLAALLLCLASSTRASDAGGAQGAIAEPQMQMQVLVLLPSPPSHFRPDSSYSGGYADAAGASARRRTAASLARDHGLVLTRSWPMPALRLECFVLEGVGTAEDAVGVAAQIGRDARVQWAQPMQVFHSLGHDDPLFSAQPTAREWRLDDLHAVAIGRGVRVAVVDSTVQLDHPDLAGQIVASSDHVVDHASGAELHGTAVAGIIGARGDNHLGMVGIAPEARLLALRACWQATPADTRCTSLSLALALHAALDRGAQIVNLSLGGPPDALIQRLIETSLARGILVVAAADRSRPGGGFPAALPGVVAVVDASPIPPPKGVLAAPGQDIPAPVPGSRWALVSGASYAAAEVSGLLALMLEARAHAHAAPRGTAASLVSFPDGRIDACASLAQAGGGCGCDCSEGRPVAALERR